MNWEENFKKIKGLPLLGLLIGIFLSSLLLIVINLYSLRIMSAVRAYINGESNYSKGEKNAAQSLLTYIQTKDNNDWEHFIQNLEIPRGDSSARVNLLTGGSMESITGGFLKGNNHEEDINDMTWLFTSFKNVPMMAKPILIWTKGDSLITQNYLIAHQIKSSIDSGNFDINKVSFLKALNENQRALTQQEIDFSENLGALARNIRDYLFYANTFIILLILGGVSFYAIIMHRRQKEQNAALANANKELDRIAYSISHDLKAPINSMMGLVNLARKETNPEQQRLYLEMMHQTLDRQERFIKEVITISKENRQGLKKEIVELDYLVEQVINTHKHMPAASDIKFYRHIGVHRVFTDPHRLEIILNNLVSNAIKYHDATKSDKVIEINTHSHNDNILIDVVDNGAGIEAKDISKIFDMYYMSKDREKGSGLGLFIVREAVTKLGGSIEVKSVHGKGSTFSIALSK